MAGINADDFLETVAPADEETFYLEFLSNSKSGQNFFLTLVPIIKMQCEIISVIVCYNDYWFSKIFCRIMHCFSS